MKLRVQSRAGFRDVREHRITLLQHFEGWSLNFSPVDHIEVALLSSIF